MSPTTTIIFIGVCMQFNDIELSENIYEHVILDELSVVGMENAVIRIFVEIAD